MARSSRIGAAVGQTQVCAVKGAWAAPPILALALAACAPPPVRSVPPLYNVDAASPSSPDHVTFLLPGALTTADIFRSARDWGGRDHLVVEYRLPGMQGEPLSPALDIHQSALWVADLANRYPQAQIQLLGYSTGAVIAIEAAGHIDRSERVKVVAVSSATPFPGAALAALRGGVEVIRSAVAIGSVDRQKVWEEYYKTLYFGRGWRNSPSKREAAKRLEEVVSGKVLAPRDGMGRAQSGDLLLWAPTEAALSSQARITFFHGERDPVFPLAAVRRLAARFGAAVCVLPEEGHLMFQSQPGLIDRIRHHFAAKETGAC
jgi:pimeloyl-ACP methyl ester carboxylesterase